MGYVSSHVLTDDVSVTAHYICSLTRVREREREGRGEKDEVRERKGERQREGEKERHTDTLESSLTLDCYFMFKIKESKCSIEMNGGIFVTSTFYNNILYLSILLSILLIYLFLFIYFSLPVCLYQRRSIQFHSL